MLNSTQKDKIFELVNEEINFLTVSIDSEDVTEEEAEEDLKLLRSILVVLVTEEEE